MEDNQSTTVSDEDVADVSLIDTPIEEPTDEPSKAEEQPKEDGSDAQDKPEDAKTEGEDTPPTEQPKEEAQPPAEDTAEQAKARAQMEYQNRQRTRQQVQKQIDENYGPKTEEDFINEGVDPVQAKLEAMQSQLDYREQRAYIAELNAGMQAEAVNVFNDFPEFNPQSPDYDPEFAQMVEAQYQTAARLQTDETGLVTNADIPLYEFHERMHNIYSRGATKGQKQAQADTAQMLARTEDIGGSSSTNTSKGDDLASLEERLGDMVIT